MSEGPTAHAKPVQQEKRQHSPEGRIDQNTDEQQVIACALTKKQITMVERASHLIMHTTCERRNKK